jgi:hypothetical protein
MSGPTGIALVLKNLAHCLWLRRTGEVWRISISFTKWQACKKKKKVLSLQHYHVLKKERKKKKKTATQSPHEEKNRWAAQLTSKRGTQKLVYRTSHGTLCAKILPFFGLGSFCFSQKNGMKLNPHIISHVFSNPFSS